MLELADQLCLGFVSIVHIIHRSATAARTPGAKLLIGINALGMTLQLNSGTVSGGLKALETSSILGESYVERERKSILR